jgi:hypothetical protein
VDAIAPGSLHKSTPTGFEQQLHAFERAADWDRGELAIASHGSRHDRLDALMSAWIASLPNASRLGYGEGSLDMIWTVPRIPLLHTTRLID